MNLPTLLWTLRRLDGRRPSMPGEHWIVLATGLRLLTARRRSVLGRAVAMAAGAALVYRALSGRDGIASLLRREVPRVDGRRTTLVDGTVVASAAEPVQPATPAQETARAPAA